MNIGWSLFSLFLDKLSMISAFPIPYPCICCQRDVTEQIDSSFLFCQFLLSFGLREKRLAMPWQRTQWHSELWTSQPIWPAVPHGWRGTHQRRRRCPSRRCRGPGARGHAGHPGNGSGGLCAVAAGGAGPTGCSTTAVLAADCSCIRWSVPWIWAESQSHKQIDDLCGFMWNPESGSSTTLCCRTVFTRMSTFGTLFQPVLFLDIWAWIKILRG